MTSTTGETIDATPAEKPISFVWLFQTQLLLTKVALHFAMQKLRPAGEWLNIRGQYLWLKSEQFLERHRKLVRKVVWSFLGLYLSDCGYFFYDVAHHPHGPVSWAFKGVVAFLLFVPLVLWLIILIGVVSDTVEGF